MDESISIADFFPPAISNHFLPAIFCVGEAAGWPECERRQRERKFLTFYGMVPATSKEQKERRGPAW